MISDYSLLRISTAEEVAKLKTFLESFGHTLSDGDLSLPILVVRKGDTWIGMVQIANAWGNPPTVFTAWSPDTCSAREIAEICQMFRFWDAVNVALCPSSRLPAYMTTNLNHEKFPPSVMDRLGFADMGLRLYQNKGT